MSRVLVIEDEDDLRLLARVILEGAGYEVLDAATGEAGLEMLAGESPDLVLLDIRLPGIDGWEVLERMSATPAGRGLPVVVMSAHTSGDSLERAKTLGISAYVVKPFTRADLLAAIESAAPAS